MIPWAKIIMSSNTPRGLLSTQPPNGAISVLAGPLKCRLAGLIGTVHPTGCKLVVQLAVKCKHRVSLCQCSARSVFNRWN